MPERWRVLPLACLAVGLLGLRSVGHQRAVPLAGPLSTVPMAIAGYVGVDRAVDSGSVRVAGMSSYLYRLYSADTTTVFSLYVGYYDTQTTGRTIHSPRNCLPGAGWQVLESAPAHVGAVTVNRYVLANGPAQAVVYYWYQGRGRVAWSEYRVKWDLLRDAARRGRSEEALVRIVVPIRPPTERENDWSRRVGAADSVAQTVARVVLPAVERALPPWEKRS